MTRRILSISAILLFAAVIARAALTYSVQDYSLKDLGDVVLSGNACSETVTMAGSGTYNISTDCQITTVTINGQSVSYPDQGTIVLASGGSVIITWQNSGLVTIKDGTTEARPAL